MFARKLRLAASKDIVRVQKSGKTLKTALFRIKTLPNDQGGVRIAVVTSKKVAKSAVVRNRVTRQTQAILRELRPHMAASVDMVVLPSPEAIEADFAVMRTDLIEGLTRIRLLPTDAVSTQVT